MAAGLHTPSFSTDMETPCFYFTLPLELHSMINEFLRADGPRNLHLIQLSSVNRFLRHQLLPIIYQDISVCGGSERVSKRLSQINSCSTPLEHTRRFEFHMEAGPDQYLRPIISLLRKVFRQLKSLKVLTFAAHGCNQIEDVFRNIRLPLVEKLNVGLYGAFAIRRCPSVTRVDYCCRRESRRSLRQLPHVEHVRAAAFSGSHPKVVEILYQDWTRDLIIALGDSQPALEGLFMHLRWPMSIFRFNFTDNFWRLPNLKYLVFPNADFWRPSSPSNKEWPTKRDHEVSIVQKFFAAFQRLAELWLGWESDVTIAYTEEDEDSDGRSLSHRRTVLCARGEIMMETFRHEDEGLKCWRANHNRWKTG